MAEPSALEAGYEPDDVRIGRVLLVAGGSLLVLMLIGLGLWAMMGVFARLHPQSPAIAIRQTPATIPPPRLQPAPKDDLAAFRAREDEVLHRWAWIDLQAGTAQIPIDDAMQALAARGWPQPDRPAPPMPPRAEAVAPEPPPTVGREEPSAGPAAAPVASPRTSPREKGPSRVTPQGGRR